MADDGQTRPSLLIRVRDPGDGEAWALFVGLYSPLVFQFARKRALQDADAADLTQIVLQEVSQAIRRLDYDPRRGSFRGWLWTIVRNQLSKWQAQQRRAPTGSGDPAVHESLEALPDRDDEAASWEREYQRRIFLWAADRVRAGVEESSWQAFWRTTVEGQSPTDTAAALSLSLGAVYTAKSRILDRIRKEIALIQDEGGPSQGES